MHLISFIGNSILLFLSDVEISQEDRETPNVKRREHNGDVTEDVHVFDFFKKTDKDYNFKKFLTPVTEKNMLLYLKIKSSQRAKYRC